MLSSVIIVTSSKMFRISTISFLLLPLPILSINLEALLESQISDAKCFARCEAATTEEDQGQCFVICKMLQETTRTDLCSMMEVCRGGCRIACSAAEHSSVQISGVTLDQCTLSWRLEDDRTNVVFLVAGEDQGSMWNLIENNLTTPQLNLTPQLASKLVNIRIFAISGHEVMDKISLKINQNNCFENVPLPKEVSTTAENEKAISLTAIILLSSGGILLLLVLPVALYFRAKAREIWDPKTEYSSEYSDSIADVNYSTIHHVEASVDRAVLAEESSDEYEDVKDDDALEYIDPFIC